MSVATMSHVKPKLGLSATVSDLQALQRQRTVYIKSMTMVSNRLQAIVAGTMGYHTGLTDKERIKLFGDAGKLIKRIVRDGEEHDMRGIVLAHTESLDALNAMRVPIEKQMETLAKMLSVAEWVQAPEQKGFGMPSLAVVVGEAGDLANYPNPGKLWARFGCHPYEKDGENHMGATWKSRARKPGVVKLSSEDWEAFGYSPRRRSIAYLIGENLIKQNGDGPYRRRYDVKKAEAAEKHPDWIRCKKCEGGGRNGKGKCSNCKGTGEVWKHCHLHGMLLAAKLLLRELWAEWNGRPEEGIWRG